MTSKTDQTARTAERNLAATRKQAVEQTAHAVEANSGLKAPSAAQQSKAQQEGVAEAIKENAKETYQALTDGNLPGDPPARQFTGMDDIMQWEPLLSLGIDEFKARVAAKSDAPIPDEKVAGLLSLERAGQNRTDYVKAMCARLEVDSPYEVTNAGPGHTNDITAVNKL